ncbi:hypothetical protein BH24ACT15_BH24ACT15_06790 [soil metagenome]
MATAREEPRSPMLANIVVILGFVLVFTTFATESPFYWIIGVILIVGGALWAGLHTPTVTTGGENDHASSH